MTGCKGYDLRGSDARTEIERTKEADTPGEIPGRSGLQADRRTETSLSCGAHDTAAKKWRNIIMKLSMKEKKILYAFACPSHHNTVGESVSPETLFRIVNEFYEEFERRFGSHIHILDWALHLDEGTPHIHERHVFDCENRYGELCPQQEKALEELGIPLPNPDKPKGRHNNRKQTFDAVCRTILFDITKRHGLHLDQEPSYGGREYLEKQDYILMKQKEQLVAQEKKLEELTLKIEDVETLLDDVSDAAYDKAVEVVTDTVRQETHKEDIRLIEETKKWVLSPERKAPQKERDYAAARLLSLP